MALAVKTKLQPNLHSQVSEILALQILSGEYQPGETLPTERELYESFGVSRTTLREAIKNLSSKGLVTVGPSIGTRVRPAETWNLLDRETLEWRLRLGVTPKLVQDMYEMRECFEPMASKFAAERGTVEHHETIWSAYMELADSREAGGERSVDADLRFHQTILLSSQNDLFFSFANVVESTLRASFLIAREQTNMSPEALGQHEAIAEAILQRQGEKARDAMATLLLTSKAGLMAAAARSRQVVGPKS